MHDGHVCSVCERWLGVALDGGNYRYVMEDDPAFEGCSYKVWASVCFDSKKRSDDEQALKAAPRAQPAQASI